MTSSLINTAEDVVIESLSGLVSTNSSFLGYLDGFPSIKVVYNTLHNGDNTVAVISGGGSGHEPAFAGYVGNGMLAAAVAGDIFAAPPEDSILAAIRHVTGKAGCLIILNNYTGDRLNFGAAAERAKAEGFHVQLTVVADDCALKGKTALGRRGLAGSVLTLKAAGAAAASGASLSQVKAVADHVSSLTATMGCSLTTCTMPKDPTSATTKNTTKNGNDDSVKEESRIKSGEMEVGLGLHGEPGAYKEKIKRVDAIVADMIMHITGGPPIDPSISTSCGEKDSSCAVSPPQSHCYLPLDKKSPVVLLINNLGATLPLEMGVISRAVLHEMTSTLGAVVQRIYVGTFMSSLDMRGFSISILKLGDGDGRGGCAVDLNRIVCAASMDSEKKKERIFSVLDLLDAPTDAPAWTVKPGGGVYVHGRQPSPLPTGATDYSTLAQSNAAAQSGGNASPFTKEQKETLLLCVTKACSALIENAGHLNDLDSAVGDGDCGSTLEKGAHAVVQAINSGALLAHDDGMRDDGARVALTVANIVGRSMGGTSGGILKIFFTAMASSLQNNNRSGGTLSSGVVGVAIEAGVSAVSTYGGAKLGDRTMIDALWPAGEALRRQESDASENLLRLAAHAARKGAEATKEMAAGAGRSSYVPEEALKGVPDPGAVAVALCFEAFSSVYD